ncbi:MAG: flagellar filament outer layer protein FlaA [Treponema sp.]|nr:flagellar filament outer layer protein FlaA [Treponema sp.]
MKRGLKVFVGLACFFVFGLPAFSQPSSRSIETFLMDSFDAANGQNYLYNGETLNWDWAVNSSRFVAEGYPKFGYYDGISNSLKQLLKGSGVEHKVFGVKTAFDRKGDNWFEIYPTKDGKPFEIPFIGTVSAMDFWVWGANYNYTLEVMLRDALGRIHVLQAGNLAFKGWKNIVVNVPTYIQQHSHLRSGPENMTLVGFRIRSDASEFVDNYVVFFDHIKFTSNSLSFIYDGYELNDVNFGDSSRALSSGDAK